MASDIGVKMANDFRKETGGTEDFFDIAKRLSMTVEKVDKDYVLGITRYFSDYLSGKNLIQLYTKSIVLWAESNSLMQDRAENLILAHETFHFLECNRIGRTSKLY